MVKAVTEIINFEFKKSRLKDNDALSLLMGLPPRFGRLFLRLRGWSPMSGFVIRL